MGVSVDKVAGICRASERLWCVWPMLWPGPGRDHVLRSVRVELLFQGSWRRMSSSHVDASSETSNVGGIGHRTCV